MRSSGVGMKAVLLSDRGVVRVSGPEAKTFLQGLVTGDVAKLGANEARWAALLSPQGKILFDFMMTAIEDGVLLDAGRPQIPDLIKRLKMYRLRAKIDIEDESDQKGVIALCGGPVGEGAADCRHPDMGTRLIAPLADIPGMLLTFGGDAGLAAYEAHRIKLGVPAGGLDFVYGDSFPHEADMDQLNGVDFKKGCFVGQEVVSRMQWRGTTRKRVVKVMIEGAAPAPGAPVVAGEKSVGVMGSSAGANGLALLRLDRAEEAATANLPLVSGEAKLTLLA